MLHLPGTIPGDTSVVARMFGSYGLDRQHTDSLSAFRDNYAFIPTLNHFPVEQPTQRDRRIALGNCAVDGSHTERIYGLLSEVEGKYGGRN